MRKVIIFAVALALLGSLTLTGFAAEEKIKISDASAQAGETVYLTVSLTDKTVADTIGISYSYDEAVLEAVPESCAWLRKGVLQDFSISNNDGVWATGKAEDLCGDICVLAFRVRSDAAFSETEVGCKVVVKKGPEEVGMYETATEISVRCDHTFGPWEENGTLGHTRVCGKCKECQTQSHSWDEGKITEDPNSPNKKLKTSTCTTCGGTKVERISAGAQETIPTFPRAPDSSESEREQQPTYPESPEHISPTMPTASRVPNGNANGSGSSSGNHGDQSANGQPFQPQDYNQAEQGAAESENSGIGNAADGQNAVGERETVPMAVPVAGGTEASESSDAEHTHETGNPYQGAVVAALAVAVLCAGGYLCYRYRKKKS